ncbi:MAG TPA: hypothetical protein VK631_01180 [Solirubrobacteraceae bacterium]|nr:hypothetical protein [Solirubrobacteraceae bacterium]
MAARILSPDRNSASTSWTMPGGGPPSRAGRRIAKRRPLSRVDVVLQRALVAQERQAVHVRRDERRAAVGLQIGRELVEHRGRHALVRDARVATDLLDKAGGDLRIEPSPAGSWSAGLRPSADQEVEERAVVGRRILS